MFGSVCWGGDISEFDRERFEKIVKKIFFFFFLEQALLWENHWPLDSLKQIQTVIKPRFHPVLSQF